MFRPEVYAVFWRQGPVTSGKAQLPAARPSYQRQGPVTSGKARAGFGVVDIWWRLFPLEFQRVVCRLSHLRFPSRAVLPDAPLRVQYSFSAILLLLRPVISDSRAISGSQH